MDFVGGWRLHLGLETIKKFSSTGFLGLGNAAAVRDLVVGGLKKIGTFGNLCQNSTGIFTRLVYFIGKIPDFIGKIKDWGNAIVDWEELKPKAAWANIKGLPIIKGIADGMGSNSKLSDISGQGSLWDRIKARFSAFGEKDRRGLRRLNQSFPMPGRMLRYSYPTYLTIPNS